MDDIDQEKEVDKLRCKKCGKDADEDGLCHNCNCCSECCECEEHMR